jgi:hypothetical protein
LPSKLHRTCVRIVAVCIVVKDNASAAAAMSKIKDSVVQEMFNKAEYASALQRIFDVIKKVSKFNFTCLGFS